MLVNVPSSASAEALPSTITQDMTLTTASSPYTSTGSVTIASGVTVTVQPGVKVKIGGTSASLIVNGTLNAQGTASDPVIFTSTAESAGWQWRGLSLEAGSGASTLDHVEVRYGGYQSYAAITVNAGSPTITNSFLHHNGGNGVTISNGAGPTIANSAIVDNARNGIYAYSATGAAIHDNDVERNRESGIYITGSVSALRDNLIKDNGVGYASAPALYVSGTIPPDIDENTLSGNYNGDVVNVYGTLSQSASWQSALPFAGRLTVGQGSTLTVAPGFVFKTSGSTSSVVVNGTIDARGTAANPIVFTSTTDTGVARWRGISLDTGSGASVLDHVDVRTAGYQSYAAIPSRLRLRRHRSASQRDGRAGKNDRACLRRRRQSDLDRRRARADSLPEL